MIGVKVIRGLRFLSGTHGIIKATKVAKMDALPVGVYVTHPALARRVPIHAHRASRVGGTHLLVPTVFRRANVSQVGNAIVGTQSVDVVDLLKRFVAIMHNPCQPMSGVERAGDINHTIAIGGKMTCDIVRESRIPTLAVKRIKNAGLIRLS